MMLQALADPHAVASLTDIDPTTLDVLRRRARREAACGRCRGYGWHPRAGLPATGETHAAQVLICGCPSGERFWALALEDADGLLALMDLDAEGRIASVDGLYGRFGANDRRLLRALAASPRAQRRLWARASGSEGEKHG